MRAGSEGRGHQNVKHALPSFNVSSSYGLREARADRVRDDTAFSFFFTERARSYPRERGASRIHLCIYCAPLPQVSERAEETPLPTPVERRQTQTVPSLQSDFPNHTLSYDTRGGSKDLPLVSRDSFRGHPKMTLRCFEGAPFCLSLESKARRMACLFHTSGKMVPRGTPPPTRQALAHRSRSCKVRLAKSAVLARRVIKSRVSAVPRDIFCSAPPLGCGFHSPLWRQTANNSTSWRLICASRARSRAGARLGRASRACSPPTCTILRRLIKLVWASLRRL